MNSMLFAARSPASALASNAHCGPTSDVLTSTVRYNFLTFNWGDAVQPRLGLAYNADLVKGDKVYGSWGIYQGIDAKSAIRSQPPFRIREDQSYFSRATGQFILEQIRGSSAGHFIPQGLTAPSYQEWVFGYAAPVGREFTVDVFYQYKSLKHPLEDTPRGANLYDSASYFGSNLRALLEARLPAIRTPSLVVQSERDPVVDPRGSERIFKRLGSPDKTHVLFNFERHGIRLPVMASVTITDRSGRTGWWTRGAERVSCSWEACRPRRHEATASGSISCCRTSRRRGRWRSSAMATRAIRSTPWNRRAFRICGDGATGSS